MNNKVKEVRLKRGMSMAELARRTGLSRMCLSNIENGKSNPLASTMQVISRELEKEVNDIFLFIL